MERRAGLILTGGGARAAYQVGVLKAIAELLPRRAHNPFPVICGTSAGALNAATLAINAQSFRKGVRYLDNIWKNFWGWVLATTRAAAPTTLSSRARSAISISISLLNNATSCLFIIYPYQSSWLIIAQRLPRLTQ